MTNVLLLIDLGPLCPPPSSPFITLSISMILALSNDPDACPRCLGKVFEAEKIQSNSRSFHKDCFTCKSCQKILNNSNCFELSNEIYCLTCYKEATSGVKNHYLDRSSIQTLKALNEDDLEACLKCKNKAFENERVMARSGVFHKSCLSCFDCSRLVEIQKVPKKIAPKI